MTDQMTPLDMAPPAAAEIHTLAEDLVWFRFTLPFRLNHINLYALRTTSGWLLLDCGINSDDTAAQWTPILAHLTATAPIIGIIISHYHADHIGYAGHLACLTNAPIMMGQIEYDRASLILSQSDSLSGQIAADAYHDFGFEPAMVARKRDEGNYYRTLVGDLPEVQIIDAGHVFDTVAGRWEVRFDAGHSPGHMSLTDHHRHLYIGVDFLLPRISPNVSVGLYAPDEDVLAAYLSYLQSMTELANDWLVLPGHDWPFYGGGVRAQSLIAHHESRLCQLLEANQPLTTKQAIENLFPFTLTDHELHFASGEARAHLNHLGTRGAMIRSRQGGATIFTPAHDESGQLT